MENENNIVCRSTVSAKQGSSSATQAPVPLADCTKVQVRAVAADHGVAGKSDCGKRSRNRRVVMLSRIDQERLAKGEISTPEEAVHISDARAVRPKFYTREEFAKRAAKATKEQVLSAHEREILAQIPPHFGKI